MIAFYNVENLFDTHDDANVDDVEYTPEGKSHWTNDKYEKKISNIAHVIKAMNKDNGADIVGQGFCNSLACVSSCFWTKFSYI